MRSNDRSQQGQATASEKSGIKHIAFIMDGNGRWAKKRLLPRSAGHKEGLKTIQTVLRAARDKGIPCLSFFAFSTENWQRPKQEVDSLMQLLKSKLPEMSALAKEQDFRLVFSGDVSIFKEDLKEIILRSSASTYSCKSGVINICLNYGGRQEIVSAANSATQRSQRLTEAEFAALVNKHGLPDPDLLIRTGGERRLSNFMLYQLAYTELYFCDTLWPDFGEPEFDAALNDFAARNRRFGKI